MLALMSLTMLIFMSFLAFMTIVSRETESRAVVVRWYAPFLADSGFGSEATQFIEALEISSTSNGKGIITEAVQFAEPATFQSASQALTRALRRSHPKDACVIAICHSTPNFWVPSEFPSWDYAAPCPPKDASFKVGRAMYETDSLPKTWIGRLNKMDEVWVPTEFAYRVFIKEGVEKEKLVIVPEPLNVDFYHKDRCREPRNDTRFTFLAVFKFEERKGWRELILSFLEEFSAADPVKLVIKTTGFHLPRKSTPRSIAETEYAELQLRRDQVVFKEDRVSEDVLLQEFFCQADAVLAPSYGEGWGRVPAEAASMGLPVLFTNYSGPTEFLNDHNAIPIAVERMVRANDEGHMWALPSMSMLRKMMRKVLESPETTSTLGRMARKTMVERYSNQVIGKKVWELLNGKCDHDPQTLKTNRHGEEL